MQPCNFSIARRPEVLKRFGISNTTLHDRIKQGLIPPPFSTGARSVGWLDHENERVIAAMVAGKSEEEIKKIVKDLIDQRKSFA